MLTQIVEDIEMNKYIRLSIASLAAGVLIAGFSGNAYSQAQQGRVEASIRLLYRQPDLVIDRGNYRQFEKSGLHLYPGQIVEIKIDHHLIYPQSGIHQSLDQISFDKRTIYRARQSGTTGLVKIEAGPVIPFYGLWALSALAREHTFSAVVDQESPPVLGQLSQH
jgi:hypothetical protein